MLSGLLTGRWIGVAAGQRQGRVSTSRIDQLGPEPLTEGLKERGERDLRGLDEQVAAFRTRLSRPATHPFVDAKFEKVRDGGRVERKCVVAAHGVHEIAATTRQRPMVRTSRIDTIETRRRCPNPSGTSRQRLYQGTGSMHRRFLDRETVGWPVESSRGRSGQITDDSNVACAKPSAGVLPVLEPQLAFRAWYTALSRGIC
jgi:hypothetical protein